MTDTQAGGGAQEGGGGGACEALGGGGETTYTQWITRIVYKYILLLLNDPRK